MALSKFRNRANVCIWFLLRSTMATYKLNKNSFSQSKKRFLLKISQKAFAAIEFFRFIFGYFSETNFKTAFFGINIAAAMRAIMT
jgi:hypothetical protein